jgi:hypothetical protein
VATQVPTQVVAVAVEMLEALVIKLAGPELLLYDIKE